MSNRRTVEMPQDWLDQAGWEAYYRSQVARRKRDFWDDHLGSIPLEDLAPLAESLRSQQMRSVWIPGCGLSPLAHLLAWLGLKVVATDISSTAIEFQQRKRERFRHLLDKLGAGPDAVPLVAEVHDFRTEFCEEAFDLIINVKAIQGFAGDALDSIARVHSRALRKGRTAVFDTMNVQGERRDLLEGALEANGFVVPFANLDREYRADLAATGIPYHIVLGTPMILPGGPFPEDPKEHEAGIERLRTLTREYRERREARQEEEFARLKGDAKGAQIIYSTG